MKQKTRFTFPIDAFERHRFKVLSQCAHFSIFYANDQISVAYLVSEPAQASKSSQRWSVFLPLLFLYVIIYTQRCREPDSSVQWQLRVSELSQLLWQTSCQELFCSCPSLSRRISFRIVVKRNCHVQHSIAQSIRLF